MNSKLDYFICFALGMCAAEAIRIFMLDYQDLTYLVIILGITFIHYRYFYK